MYGNEYESLYSLMIMIFVFYGVLILGWLAGYIVKGIGIMRLSATLGRRNGWLGFIPIAKDYQVGQMAGDIDIGERKVKNPGLWMALLPVIVNAVFYGVYFIFIFSSSFRMMIEAASYASSYYYDPEDFLVSFFAQFFIGFLVIYLVLYAGGVIIRLFRMLALHRIFGYFYEGQKPVFYLVLSTFVPFAESILMIKTAKRPVVNPPAYPFETAYYPPQPYGQQPYPGQPYQQGYPPNQGYGPYDQQQGYQYPQQQWQDYGGQQPQYPQYPQQTPADPGYPAQSEPVGGQPQQPQYPPYPQQAPVEPGYPPVQDEPVDRQPPQPSYPQQTPVEPSYSPTQGEPADSQPQQPQWPAEPQSGEADGNDRPVE